MYQTVAPQQIWGIDCSNLVHEITWTNVQSDQQPVSNIPKKVLDNKI